MNRYQQAFVQSVLSHRNKFLGDAGKMFRLGLNEQIKPVISAIKETQDPKKLAALIKEAPLKYAMKTTYKEVGASFGKVEYEALSQKRLKDDGSDYEDFINDEVASFIEEEGAMFVTEITETTRDLLKRYIQDNIIEGEGAASLAGDLSKYFTDFNSVRSMLIARTEVGRASNWAGQVSRDKFSDDNAVDLMKTWLHAGSSKNDRESHVEASGQTVANDDSFDVDSDYTPDYPQDGSGGANEEANCNCCVYASRAK